MNLLNQELTEFILTTIKSVSRFTSLKIEGAIYNSTLVFLIDDSILYSLDLSGKIGSDIIIGFESDQIVSYEETGAASFNNTLITSSVAYNKITNLYNSITNECNSTTCLFDDPYILEDEQFSKKSSIKATEGCEMYNARSINGEFISVPVFAGLPLLIKNDTVGLSIYKSINNQYIVKYNVFKKKLNTNCFIHYRILDINRPLRG